MSENIMKRLKVLTKAQFLELPEIDANVRYFITDMPENQIDNADMALAITTEAALYNAGDIFICKDTDAYEKGHIYQLNSTKDAWEDITPASGSSTIIGTTDPTTSTVGTVGQFYLNATTGKLFICKSITSGTPDTYEWGTPSNLVDTASTSNEFANYKEFRFNHSYLQIRDKTNGAQNITIQPGDNSPFFIRDMNSWYMIKCSNGVWFIDDNHGKRNRYPLSSGTFALLQNLASDFSTGTAYAVGNLVVYSDKLYKCTTSHTGAWDASHFTEVTLADIIPSSITKAFGNGFSQLGGLTVVRDIVGTSAASGNYLHHILLNYQSSYQWATLVNFEIVVETNSDIAFTTSTFASWLNTNGYTQNDASHTYKIPSFVIPLASPNVADNGFAYGLYSTDGTSISVWYNHNYYVLTL